MSRQHRLLVILCLLAVASLVAACKSEEAGEPTPTLTASPAATALTPSPAEPSQTPTPGGAVFATGPITLTVWTIQEFAPSDTSPGGRLLLDQLLAFDRSHPDINLDVVVKRASGPGGIDDYLNIASQVAPSVLPDVAVMDRSTMLTAASLQRVDDNQVGLVYPLDDLLLPETIDDLLPIARDMGTIDGQLMGAPFMLDLEHVVYNSAILTDTAPLDWQAILDSGGPYVFPAGVDAPVDSTLLHYVAAGGALYDSNGLPHLELDPLTEVFRFYQRGDQDHVIPVAALQALSLEESWNAYRNGNVLISHVLASDYMGGREDLLNSAVAPIPGPEGPGVTFASGWLYTICNPDPTSQRLAAELLSWLLAGDNLGVWSYASQWLPSTESAFAVWPVGDDYVEFAHKQLDSSIVHPDTSYMLAVQTPLSSSVRDVLLGNASPAAAAAAGAP